jgi:hypothetical protein
MAAMTREAVTARLRAMAEASKREPSPMARGVDMSSRSVTSRLREMSDVSALCAKLVGLGARARLSG